MIMANKYLSVNDAALRYKCSRAAIYSYIKRGELSYDTEALNKFGVKRIREKDFDALVSTKDETLVETRRAVSLADVPKGYLTINQATRKYKVPRNRLNRYISEGRFDAEPAHEPNHKDKTGRGWMLLLEKQLREVLGIEGEDINAGSTGGN